MADWVWIGVAGVVGVVGLTAAAVAGLQLYYRHWYLDQVVRIFEARPLFVVPKGRPIADAEDIHFETAGGFTLRGCYLKAHAPRKGVILFGLEFGSNRWACSMYCHQLLDAGYDVFAFEPRNQGESDKDDGYAPLQWVTDRDRADMLAALTYLKRRKDAPPDGVGVMGVSKGASAAILVARFDPWVRCVATDGAYGTYTTVVPYMRKWVTIYIRTRPWLRKLVPSWFYGMIGRAAIRKVAARRGVRFLNVERALRKLKRPLFMIHGQGDTYIKPEMAETLFDHAGTPHKSLWLVPGAKHNQAMHVAGDEYHRRLIEFFDLHLAGSAGPDSGVILPVAAPGLPGPARTDRLAAAG